MTTKFTGGTTPAYFSTQRPCEHELRIDGYITADIGHDEWLERFIEWLEVNGWQFGGITSLSLNEHGPQKQQVERLREFIRLHGKHLPHEVWLDAVDLLEEE